MKSKNIQVPVCIYQNNYTEMVYGDFACILVASRAVKKALQTHLRFAYAENSSPAVLNRMERDRAIVARFVMNPSIEAYTRMSNDVCDLIQVAIEEMLKLNTYNYIHGNGMLCLDEYLDIIKAVRNYMRRNARVQARFTADNRKELELSYSDDYSGAEAHPYDIETLRRIIDACKKLGKHKLVADIIMLANGEKVRADKYIRITKQVKRICDISNITWDCYGTISD